MEWIIAYFLLGIMLGWHWYQQDWSPHDSTDIIILFMYILVWPVVLIIKGLQI